MNQSNHKKNNHDSVVHDKLSLKLHEMPISKS